MIAALAGVGCKSLDIVNPNAPDAERALADPAAIEAVMGGSVRVWFNTYEGLEGVGPLVTQAQTYTSAWNNFNMLFYSSVDNPTDPPSAWVRTSRTWQNDLSKAARTSVEHFWSGYYSSLSLATNVLRAIRNNGVVINNASDTKRAEAVALLMQGASLSGIALNYDKGYIIDENTNLATLEYSNRKELRDAALEKFDDAIAASTAAGVSFTTPAAWANGRTYSNQQIAKIAATMAAHLLASWPRDPAENAQVPWDRVVSYASQGMSSGTPFDYVFIGNGSNWYPEIFAWFQDILTGRVHTRVAALLDPATQSNPFPNPAGNPPPNSPDKRLGDGSFGDPILAATLGTEPETGNGGTDFAYSGIAIFAFSRGFYHQSNIGHIRYDVNRDQDPNGAYGGRGPAPVFTATQNDLLWAEGLIETNSNLSLAATLINKTRVGRGGLPAADASDGVTGLRAKLRYEMEIELLGLGAASYYHRRRVEGGLLPGTPREMPVPAKELGVFGQPVYTWGGATPNSPTPP